MTCKEHHIEIYVRGEVQSNRPFWGLRVVFSCGQNHSLRVQDLNTISRNFEGVDFIFLCNPHPLNIEGKPHFPSGCVKIFENIFSRANHQKGVIKSDEEIAIPLQFICSPRTHRVDHFELEFQLLEKEIQLSTICTFRFRSKGSKREIEEPIHSSSIQEVEYIGNEPFLLLEPFSGGVEGGTLIRLKMIQTEEDLLGKGIIFENSAPFLILYDDEKDSFFVKAPPFSACHCHEHIVLVKIVTPTSIEKPIATAIFCYLK